MRRPNIHSSVTITIDLIQLDEKEIRALDALVGYGTDEFLKQFYKVMGKSYLQPYEAGLRSFFDGMRSVCRQSIRQIDEARKVLKRHEDAQK